MFHHKAVALAVASLLVTAGYAAAETSAPKLSLEPVVTAAEAPARAPLMAGLDAIGAGSTLDQYGINVYGWLQVGYTYNHRNTSSAGGTPKIALQPFNHQVGDHLMMNQLVLRAEKLVDTSKTWDIGGMIELMYGTDANAIHSSGLPWNGDDPESVQSGEDSGDDRYNPQYQFDIVQAYLDISLGNGIKVRAGKFATLIGYEYIAAPFNPLYSKSLLFSVAPFTHTGVLGYWTINDQWSVAGGITRGWDNALSDNNNNGIDFLGQIAYTPNKQWSFYVNGSFGPQNYGENDNWRSLVDVIANWTVTEQLSLGAELIYVCDGGFSATPLTGSAGAKGYGDAWGGAGYAKYVLNEYMTLNARVEKLHYNFKNDGVTNNVYSATLGVTIKPFPKDRWGSNLMIRPEARYDVSEDAIFTTNSGDHKDQLTFGADVIFTF